MAREKTIENYLKDAVEERKGLCIKLAPFWFKGIPDRMVLMPMRKIFFVETKMKGKKPSSIQKIVHKKLMALGFEVWVIDSNEQVIKFITHAVYTV